MDGRQGFVYSTDVFNTKRGRTLHGNYEDGLQLYPASPVHMRPYGRKCWRARNGELHPMMLHKSVKVISRKWPQIQLVSQSPCPFEVVRF